jgi:hypothetical protein
MPILYMEVTMSIARKVWSEPTRPFRRGICLQACLAGLLILVTHFPFRSRPLGINDGLSNAFHAARDCFVQYRTLLIEAIAAEVGAFIERRQATAEPTR